jgi:hypothetical protein
MHILFVCSVICEKENKFVILPVGDLNSNFPSHGISY